jgi:pilus assembly protein CpaB
MGRRTVLLIAALVVAALGTVLIFVYVKNADDRAQADAAPVDVLVATQDVAAGTTAADASNAGAFEIQEVPTSAAAQGALTDISIISDQVALAPIFPGQQILAQMFGAPGSETGLNVPKDKLAISVQLGDPERVAGFVAPGSDVAIFATVAATGATATGESTQVLLPKVEVIGVGATSLSTQTVTTDTGEQTTEEIPRTILTLAVDQKEAQRVINAQSAGSLYFGLLGDEAKVRTGSPTTSQNLFR